MKLGQYLEQNGLTLGQLAQQCGTSASTILRIKDAEVAPSKRVAWAIWEATGGQVTPNDIYSLHYAEGHCPCRAHSASRTSLSLGKVTHE
ncbi:helix-turn-helix domain-containing protein [Jannaschia marina]|uniref:helix-turn-helix domain-containing protein n=1 Tax=Jannaschia marina TaxID=2741674 RepID=UPI0015CB7450